MLKNFVRRYGYYMLAFSLILAIGISVGLSNPTVAPNVPNGDNSEPAGTAPIEMLSPVTGAEVLKWYSDTELFYNTTLKQWESHKGVDLTSTTSNDVFAVLDGTVIACSYNFQDGYCIQIEHDGGIVSTYCSLKDSGAVKKGDIVSRGQKIGEMSTSASDESEDGAHLHFQVSLNGKSVDPANYITFENK